MTFSGYHVNPRYAKIVIRNADCKAMFHFRVHSYHIKYNLFLTNPASSSFQKHGDRIERSCWLMDLVENTRTEWSTDRYWSLQKRKWTLSKTSTDGWILELAEKQCTFSETCTDLRTLDRRSRRQELAESTHSKACESFVWAWPTEDHSLRFHMCWSEAPRHNKSLID